MAALTGCSASAVDTSEPTPTPTSSAAAEEAAYARALAAVQNMTHTAQAVLASDEADTAPLEEYATGEALQNQLATVQRYRDESLTASGQLVVEPLDHSVRDREDQAPAVAEGEVVIQACVDYTGWHLTRPDGSEEPLSGSARSTLEYQVRLDTVSDRWQVYAVAATGKDC